MREISLCLSPLYRIALTWEDKRYMKKKTGIGNVGRYNEHRQTECPSNHITYEDTKQLWRPYLQVLDALTLVNLIDVCDRIYSNYLTSNLGGILERAIKKQPCHKIRCKKWIFLHVDELLRQSKMPHELCNVSIRHTNVPVRHQKCHNERDIPSKTINCCQRLSNIRNLHIEILHQCGTQEPEFKYGHVWGQIGSTG